MADPLSITASIVGIVTLGFQVAKGLYQIADGIGTAGEEVRLYAGEINEFSKLLAHIRTEILTTPDIPFDSRSLIKDVVDICDKVLEPLHCLQEILKSFFTRFKQSPKKLKQFALRVRWIFRDKRKLLFYLDALRSQHRILNTALDLASLHTTRDRSPQNICILKMSLENSFAAINMPSSNNSGGVINSLIETNEQPSIDFLVSESALISTQEESNTSNNVEDTRSQSVLIENSLDLQSSTTLTIRRNNFDDHPDQLTEDEIQLLERQIEEALDPDSGITAAEVCEDIRSISRKAKRLASEALSSRETVMIPIIGTSASLNHKDYSVGWVCTRPIEYAVAEGMLDERHPALPQIEGDSNIYTLGRILKHNVVLLCIPSGVMNTGVTVTAVSNMLRSFPNIWIRLLVGIGSGVASMHSDIRLGDVVVGSPVNSSGGVILFNSSEDTTAETGRLETPPKELGNALPTLQGRHMRRENEIPRYVRDILEANPVMRTSFSAPDPETDLLFEPLYEHGPDYSADCQSIHNLSRVIPRVQRNGPVIHYGPIGWIKSIIKDGCTRDVISGSSQTYILSIEQEIIGLINFFPCLVIRGIWNYADSHNTRLWQGYAAAVAAAYAKELLETLPTARVVKIIPT